MGSRTKIIVLHMKEIIYTAIFARTWYTADCPSGHHVQTRGRKRRDRYETNSIRRASTHPPLL